VEIKNMKTFEEFLEEKYDEINSNSNNMNREFEMARDRWFENLDVQEVIDYAEEWMKKYKIELLSKIAENLIKYADPKAQYDGLFASKLAELILN
jgi:hypothetical protein